MSAPAIPIPPNIGSIAASQLIGSLLNFCLYGVLAVQVYIWRLSFPSDKATIKWLVYLIFLVETVATALNGYDIYYWFAAGFGDILRFSKPHVSPFYTPILGSVMALVVQTFFSWRIYIIKRQVWPLCIFILLISLLQAAGGLGGGISSYLSANEEHDHNRVIFVYLWLIGEAVADVLIAVTMTYLLLKAGQQQHRQTNDIVKRIVRLTVETNTASTVVAIISLILFYGTPNTTYFIAPTMVLAKLYANTLLVTFNNRAFIHKAGSSHVQSSTGMSNTYTGSTSAKKSQPFSAGLGLGTNNEERMTFADPGRVTITSTSRRDYEFDDGSRRGDAYALERFDSTPASLRDKPNNEL
ncbi:hypothetical protein MIND_00121400 [Mycena indigotica]|uniref:DUF6534 domain-containing protein n=1 Tax=Mycena indigotica TaxID=2126181 RepID=A0A8H6WFR5_9AGAR|nr:uncharacterized protein MIND_00121400 [Mycena indigotica]KAF7316037.1 hypothetical protein MIND_00121400 [Mycena indigotica]